MLPNDPIPELNARELRKFGFTTGGIVAVLFGLVFPWLLERNWPVWPWILLALLALPALLLPRVLRPVYRGWMTLGLLASKITTPLILGTVFFFIVCPMRVLRGACGKNHMREPFRASVTSYRRPSSRKPASSLERPF